MGAKKGLNSTEMSVKLSKKDNTLAYAAAVTAGPEALRHGIAGNEGCGSEHRTSFPSVPFR